MNSLYLNLPIEFLYLWVSTLEFLYLWVSALWVSIPLSLPQVSLSLSLSPETQHLWVSSSLVLYFSLFSSWVYFWVSLSEYCPLTLYESPLTWYSKSESIHWVSITLNIQSKSLSESPPSFYNFVSLPMITNLQFSPRSLYFWFSIPTPHPLYLNLPLGVSLPLRLSPPKNLYFLVYLPSLYLWVSPTDFLYLSIPARFCASEAPL